MKTVYRNASCQPADRRQMHMSAAINLTYDNILLTRIADQSSLKRVSAARDLFYGFSTSRCQRLPLCWFLRDAYSACTVCARSAGFNENRKFGLQNGVGHKVHQRSFHNRNDPSGSRNRTYILCIPTHYGTGIPSPVVFSHHGREKNASYQQNLIGLSVEGVGKNPGRLIAVYPQGVKNACEGAPYATKGISDIDFFGAVLDTLDTQLCIDPSCIYVTGKSNGGGSAALLACTPHTADRIAAVAPASVAFYPAIVDNCNLTKKITPIFCIQGVADKTKKFEGGVTSGYLYHSVHTVFERWAGYQGCANRKPTINWGSEVSQLHCEKTKPNARTLVQYKVNWMGHWWTSPAPDADNPAGGSVDGTKVIVDFLQKWTSPSIN